MLSYNPGKAPKDEFLAASIWEGLRHNKTYRDDVKAILSGNCSPESAGRMRGSNWGLWCMERMCPSSNTPLADDENIYLGVQQQPEFRVNHGLEQLLILKSPWDQTPGWFREDFPILANDSNPEVVTKDEGLDLAEFFLDLLSTHQYDAMRYILQDMRGRMCEIPKRKFLGKASMKPAIDSFRKLLGLWEIPLPTKDNWELYLALKEARNETGYTADAVMADVLLKYKPIVWGGYLESVGVGFSPEERVRKATTLMLKDWGTGRPNSSYHLGKVEGFISGVYP